VNRRPDLLERTDAFALASLAFYRTLPKTTEAQVPGVQFLKASSAVSANYHAARRGRSTAEFVSKLGTVVEEIDEAVVWLEYLRKGGIADQPQLRSEAEELRCIFGTALATARRNRRHSGR